MPAARKLRREMRRLARQIESAEAVADDRCPPHQFEPVYIGEDKPARLFCKACGEVREASPASVPAPELERLP